MAWQLFSSLLPWSVDDPTHVIWPLQLSHDHTQLSHDLTVTWPHTMSHDLHDCHMTSHNFHMTSQLSHDLTQLSHDLTQLSHGLTTVTWPHTNVTWPHKTVTWPSLIRGGLLGRKKENSDNSCCYEKSIVWFLVFWEMWTENWRSVPSCYISPMIYHCGGKPEQAVHCWLKCHGTQAMNMCPCTPDKDTAICVMKSD